MLPAYMICTLNVLLLTSEARRRARERRRRRAWLHPITAQRVTYGAYPTLYRELRQHPVKFHEYFCMTVATFDELYHRISPRLQRQDASLQRCVSPVEQLMLTLRFLATGESFASLDGQFRIRKTTLSNIIVDTCKAFWDVLHEEYIPHPSTRQWLDIADKFWEVTQFPNCIGAFVGKHIRIQKPSAASSAVNYKDYFSVILLAIADTQYRFVAVDLGALGQTNDSVVFKSSAIGRRLYSGNFGVPAPRPFPGTDGPSMPFVVVSDEAFQMCGNLVKPYSNRGLNFRKRIFNYRLTRARGTVECAFGIMSSKWRILMRPIQLKLEFIDCVVKACIVLHNFLLMKEPLTVDPLKYADLPPVQAHAPKSAQAVTHVRESFSEFFLSTQGWVDWQEHIA